MAMDVGIFPRETQSLSMAEFAIRAEELKYESIWKGEHWGDNALIRLAEIATVTDSIGIGSAITNVFSRTPATIAMAAYSLNAVSDDRFRLGVGPSTEALVENLHSVPFDRPIGRLREAIEVIRALTNGGDDPVDYSGDQFTVRGFRPIGTDVPIYNAALGPRNLELTGTVCDGWIPHNVPFSRLDDRFDIVASAAEAVDRDPSTITVAPYIPTAVHDDPTVANRAIRGHLAYYIGVSEHYKGAVASGYDDEAQTVQTAWRAGDRERARTAVTDEMVADLSVAGTPREAKATIDRLHEDTCVDLPLLAVPRTAGDEVIERTLESLGPATW